MSRLPKTVRPQGFFTVDEVLKYVNDVHKNYVGHDGTNHRMYMYHRKLQVFRKSNGICVACGLKPSHFVLYIDRHNPKYKEPFFILYARNGTMMTIDHIFPRSKGGSDQLENLQCMCSNCNRLKSDNEQWMYSPTRFPSTKPKVIAKREKYYAW